MSRKRRTGLARLADVALTVLAIAGAIALAATIAGAATGTSLVLFASGSMSPTIPVGSAAIVREIPATDIAVGDVITVDRLGQLPITHRVTAVLERTDTAATFTMRGDANATADPSPYTAERVRLVIASVPGIASTVQTLRSPAVIVALAALVALLVTMALWPAPTADAAEDDTDGDRARADDPTL